MNNFTLLADTYFIGGKVIFLIEIIRRDYREITAVKNITQIFTAVSEF